MVTPLTVGHANPASGSENAAAAVWHGSGMCAVSPSLAPHGRFVC